MLLDGGVSETMLKGPESPILKQEEAALTKKRRAGALSASEQARLAGEFLSGLGGRVARAA